MPRPTFPDPENPRRSGNPPWIAHERPKAMPTKNDEKTAKEYGWKKYTFRYRTHEGDIKSRDVYASDDQTATILFDKTYSREVKEVL